MIEGDRRARHAIAIDEYLAGVERAVGARRVLTSGTAENLFAALDANELDLVVDRLLLQRPHDDDVAFLRLHPVGELHLARELRVKESDRPEAYSVVCSTPRARVQP